ncbi:hypothetical protein SDC9_201281 [bioreactor metagenome]|uniref:Uncharacterized protein n=1 Tax=bioreactor metagenome TaxID=1076179 RepID=A0A645IQV0_9ZZZZ
MLIGDMDALGVPKRIVEMHGTSADNAEHICYAVREQKACDIVGHLLSHRPIPP